MSRRHQINERFRRAALRKLPALVILAALMPSCVPRVAGPPADSLNPVEILERSPRTYHIRFEDIADKIETDRAALYLEGSLGAEFATDLLDTTEIGEVTDKDRALVEYGKAVRRFHGGAGRASLMHTRKALELDPGYGPAYVLLGNLLLAQGRTEDALDLFSQVVRWDMTNSEALVGLARCYMFAGQLDSARHALVDAVIYDHVNLEAWRNLHVLGSIERFTVADHDVAELGYVRKDRGRHYDIVIEDSLKDCPSKATAWIVFASERAVWRYEGKFKTTFGTTRYHRTYQEDLDCFMALAAAWKILSQEDSTACEGGYLDYLSKVADDGFLVPHVLFDYVCLDDPLAARSFRPDVIDKMRAYVNTYILARGG
jgi:tetratricopeptide (TPR) repeat protein